MTEPSIKEVFFDWDGTFADTEAISAAVTRRVLTDYATSALGAPKEEELGGIDMRGKDFGQIAGIFQDAVNKGLPENRRIKIAIEDLRINKLRPLASIALLNAKLAPGIAGALGELQDDMKVGLSVVSNSPRLRIQPLLDKHGFNVRIPKGRLFSAFEDVAKLKEDPAIYLLAAEKTGISTAEAAAVEDSATGMRAATAAKIGLRIGYTGLVERANVTKIKQALIDAGAHVVIDDMRELPAIIRSFRPAP